MKKKNVMWLLSLVTFILACVSINIDPMLMVIFIILTVGILFYIFCMAMDRLGERTRQNAKKALKSTIREATKEDDE